MKKTAHSTLRPQTRAIHAGEPPRHGVGAPVTSAIVRSSTFTLSSSEELKLWAEGKSKVFMYHATEIRRGDGGEENRGARGSGGRGGHGVRNGAISSTLLTFLGNGDELISTAQVYGGAYQLMRDIFPRFGITVGNVESSLEGLEALLRPKTKCLYVETPTNPTLYLVDLQKAAAFARKHHLISIVDNTFATPILQNPIEYGFDLVVHSVTKGLSGHSDLLGGVATGNAEYVARVRHMVSCFGGCMDPDVAFLLMRGMKTLGVRLARQCETALRVAKFLEKHPRLRVFTTRGLHRIRTISLRKSKCAGSAPCWHLT